MNKLNSVLFISASVLVSILYILPQFQMIGYIAKLALVTFVYFCIFCIKYIKFQDIKILIGFVPFFLIFFIVSKSFDIKYGFLHPILLLWNIIFPIFMYKAVANRNQRNEKYILSAVSILFAVYVIYNTITMMSENPTIARAMTSGNTDKDYVESVKLLGVGGFGISYSSGLLAICSFVVFLYSDNRIIRILGAVLMLFFLYMVVNAQFTTLLIITAFSFIVVIFYKYSFSSNNKLFYLILIGLLVMVLPLLFEILISWFGDTPVGNHLQELYSSLYGSGSTEESQRSSYQKQCFILMLESPLWGRSVEGSYSYLYLHSHSTLLGYGLATGVVGVLSYFITLIKLYVKNLPKIYAPFNNTFLPVLVFYILLAVFNPVDSIEISYSMFLIIPLIYNCVFPDKNDEYEALEK